MFTRDYKVTTRNVTSKCLIIRSNTETSQTIRPWMSYTQYYQYALKTWRYEIVSIYEELKFGLNHLGLQTMSWNTSIPARLASPINIDLGFADNVCVSSVLRSCPQDSGAGKPAFQATWPSLSEQAICWLFQAVCIRAPTRLHGTQHPVATKPI